MIKKSKYTESPLRYIRRKTRVVNVGNIEIGGNNPVRVQTMTNTDTNDVEATVKQCLEVYNEGAELIRITTQGLKEVKSLIKIKQELTDRNVFVPLIADVHFSRKVAEYAATIIDKVRINPGNYAEKKGKNIEEEVKPFLNICRKHKTAIRIGTNHGSLSERIMNSYGDSPEGMAESAMEFLRICIKEKFYDVIVSLKASNPLIMIYAYRLLIVKMQEENMDFPLHLGVTETGYGNIGRIKSAIGIGSLMSDGIGDTIRVSLTENPVQEIPVAKKLVKQFSDYDNLNSNFENSHSKFFPYPFDYKRRESFQVLNIGKSKPPVVVGAFGKDKSGSDYQFSDNEEGIKKALINEYSKKFPVYTLKEYVKAGNFSSQMNFVRVSVSDIGDNEELIKKNIELISNDTTLVIILETNSEYPPGERRRFFSLLKEYNCKNPVIIHLSYDISDEESFMLKAAVDAGILFIDGLGDGLWIENKNSSQEFINSVSFDILQACRVRLTQPDYISCPGCGRTLFRLLETTEKIKQHTAHLKGLKIAIMGCIVNGPGEMADADYGYVGASAGKINLYKSKNIIKKNIPEDRAVEELINLIKEKGDWKEKTS
ncbi:(E)-4-hydroxy-3-methylbut-2-enyl-diphosphate synthase [Bacteroidota bacterium]